LQLFGGQTQLSQEKEGRVLKPPCLQYFKNLSFEQDNTEPRQLGFDLGLGLTEGLSNQSTAEDTY
jgi:hypothetical protein